MLLLKDLWYQLSTALYSARWQIESKLHAKKDLEEGDIKPALKIDTIAIAADVVYFLFQIPIIPNVILNCIGYNNYTIPELISGVDTNESNTQYIKALCGLPAKNIIIIRTRKGVISLKPIKKYDQYQEKHFSTLITQGR